eukprot:scaffold14652_cov75-Attheya_sp.AAC.1
MSTNRPDTFEEAEFSTLPVRGDILTARSAFHDEIMDEEKAAKERMSTHPRTTSTVMYRRPGGQSGPPLNHGGVSQIERRHFAEQHLQHHIALPQLDQDNSSVAVISNNGKKKRKLLVNPVSVQEMRDGVVDKGLATTREKDTYRKRHARLKSGLYGLLRGALEQPIVNWEKLTPEKVMDFISQQANQFTGKPLSTQGYGGKRSAIKHLVRCHNMRGHSEAFETRLATLWRGFLRASDDKTPKLKKKRKRQNATSTGGGHIEAGETLTGTAGSNGDDDESVESEDGDESDEEVDDDFDDSDEYKTGKVPITPELFRKLCLWSLEWGTADGIFGALFFCQTWNLICRGNNSAKVRFSHMTWNTFDAMKINFRHTKTEKHKQGKRKKRAIFSNPFEYYIDYPFLLGLYLATNFSFEQSRGRKLFPGSASNVADRVAGILARLLEEHESEVLAMGYDSIKDIGIHSFRKGIGSQLASLPGGPSAASLCLRAGWSMGQVRDIYFQQTQVGDEFVGRCASLLNMVNGDFAVSPAFFSDDTDDALVKNVVKDVFPHFSSMLGTERMLRMCLASLLHHRDKVLAFDSNHIARNGISIFRNMNSISGLAEKVKVVRAWESRDLAITGVPPHIKQIVDLQKLREESSALPQSVTKSVMVELKQYLESRGISGGELTEARVNDRLKGQLEYL